MDLLHWRVALGPAFRGDLAHITKLLHAAKRTAGGQGITEVMPPTRLVRVAGPLAFYFATRKSRKHSKHPDTEVNEVVMQVQSELITTAKAAIAAVSARKMVGPSDTGIQPALTNISCSALVQPPSGPTANAETFSTSFRRFSAPNSAKTTLACPLVAMASFNCTGSAISGGLTRRD